MLLRTSTTGFRTAAPRRGGFVIVAVLLVIAVLTLAAYQYSTLMDAEYLAAQRMRKAAEARVLADAGVHYAVAMLADPDALTVTLNDNPFDNPKAFQGVLVKEADSPRATGKFSLMAPDYANVSQTGVVPMRFGVTDEASKLNVNALYAADSSGQVLHDALMKLPNMTDDAAWCIVDWVDPNDEPSAAGAESQYYSALTPPYQCKNAPLDTVEELLLIKGVTPALLYGTDRNRNGKTDPGEDDGYGSFSAGWAAYLTVYSRERNVDSEGAKRININGNDLATLNADLTAVLGEELTAFLLVYRLYGPTNPTAPPAKGPPARPGTPAQMTAAVQRAIQAGTAPRTRLPSLFALMEATVTVAGSNPRQGSTTHKSPLKADAADAELLGKLLDKCTTSANAELPARVNANTAPREVLMALPGMTDADADLIISKRPTYLNGDAPDPAYSTVAWLVTTGGLKPTAMAALERFVTARTQVYRVTSVGHFDEAGPIARVESVIDVNQGKPRIAYYRDLTDLGRVMDPRTVGQ